MWKLPRSRDSLDEVNVSRSSNWLRQLREGDSVMEGGRSSDIVILVMGLTGAGKSTFINDIVNSQIMTVGHDLESCTRQLQIAVIDEVPNRPLLRGRRLVLVDTPGFDDSLLDDAEVLRRVAIWLASFYGAQMSLGGIVYLHSIAHSRMSGSSALNLTMFQKLCGRGAFERVVIGTTKWDGVSTEVGTAREKHLMRNFWRELLSRGSVVRQIGGDSGSAWQAISTILDRTVEFCDRDPVLKIQKELVDWERLVPLTEAGKTLRFNLQDLLKRMSKTELDGDELSKSEVYEKLLKQLAAMEAGGTPSRRILSFFGL